jgi:hypothetical protein
VGTLESIKALVSKRDAAGFLLRQRTNCSSLSDNPNQMILHGASMLDLDQDLLHHLQEETAMFQLARNSTVVLLALLKMTARQEAAAGTQHLIHSVSLILLGATTKKVLTLALHQLGMPKIQDSPMTSTL